MSKRMKRMGGRAGQILLALCLSVLLSVTGFPVAAQAAVLQRDDYPEWVFQITSSLGNVYGPISRLRLDGREVFCVQVERQNATGDIYPDPIPAADVYNPELLHRLGLITLFGYEQTGKTKLDIAFTKLFVYEAIGHTILGLIDYSGANVFTMSAYNQYKAAIEAKITAYMSRVSFHGQTIELTAGQPQHLVDTNHTLDGYRVLSAPAGIAAQLSGSTLILEASAAAEPGQIILQRSVAEKGTSLLYQPPGRQAVIESKIDAPRQSIVNVSVITTGGFTLTKQTSDGLPLGGARFRLTAPDQSTQELDVPASGLLLENLPAGDYFLEEIEAPPGYRLDTTARTVTVRAGETAAVNLVSVTNEEQSGSLRIVKKSPDGGTIAGARFEISRDEHFSSVVASGESDADGRLTINGLSLVSGARLYIRETAVPHPYILDPQVQSVLLKDNHTVEVEFSNEIKPWRLQLEKTDEEGRPIPDVVFSLSRSEEFPETLTLTTDAGGQAEFSGTDRAGEGLWYIREEHAPAPYLLDQTIHAVELVCGETSLLQFVNDTALGTIELKKTDRDTKQPLEGAHYRFLHSESELLLEAKTDESGTIMLRDLPLGKYVITEMAAPEGYVRDEAVHELDIDYLDFRTPVIFVRKDTVNTRIRGRIRILKKEKQNGAAVEGAVFVVLDQEGREQALLVTNSDGIAESEDLLYGRYVVREVDRPDAFYADPFEAEVDIKSDGEVVDLNVTNERIELRLQVNKRCAESGLPLSGACFEILDESGTLVAVRDDERNPFTLVTDAAGHAWSDLTLGIGTYLLIEVCPPSGYATGVPRSFEITRDTEHIVLESGSRLLKTDISDAPTVVDILKTDEMGRVLTDALLAVYDCDGQVVSIWHSGLTAHRLTRLTAGETYVLEELAAPAGFTPAEPLFFTVADTAAVQVVTCVNEPTEIVLDKRDRETGEPLAGMVFNIRQDGQPVYLRAADESVYRAGGTAAVQVVTGPDGLARIRGLAAGLYEVVETSAPGYRLDVTPRFIDLKSGHGPETPYRLDWFNDRLQITVEKQDADTGMPLAGVRFTVAREDGSVLTFAARDGIYCAEEGGDPGLLTDTDGRFKVTGLLPGRYVCREVEPLAGYFVGEPLTFTVTDKETADLTFVITNKQMPFPVTGGGDAKTWPLVGTLFVLNGAGLVSIRMLLKDRRQRRRR